MSPLDISVSDSWDELARHYSEGMRIAYLCADFHFYLGKSHYLAMKPFGVEDRDVQYAGYFTLDEILYHTYSRLKDSPVPFGKRGEVDAIVNQCRENFAKVQQKA